jgi:signal recognition particle GTPase
LLEQRIEDLRRADQEADFARQETILKLISTELTKNTTRVVEQAIKSEVQNTVLPALEAITKNEIKAALGNQVAKGIADSLKSALPGELERLLLRSDISAHIARTFTTNVTPLVERQIKESFTKTLIPAFQQASQAMQVDLARDVSSELLGVKKEIITWQSEAIRSTEVSTILIQK